MRTTARISTGVAGAAVFSTLLANAAPPTLPVPHLVAVPCPPLGHTFTQPGPLNPSAPPPSAPMGTWAGTYSSGNPGLSVTASATASARSTLLTCSYSSKQPSTAQATLSLGSTYSCSASQAAFSCSTPWGGQFNVACPALSGTDSSDAAGWTTVHPAGTQVASVSGGFTLSCSNQVASGSVYATSTRTAGSLENCQVDSSGTGFVCRVL